MGFFLYLGVISKLKNEGHLNNLEEISGSSAGGILGFLYCVTKGDVAKVLDVSLGVPIHKIMKPNIKNLLTSYGLVAHQKIRKVLEEICVKNLNKNDVTFKELYERHPVKLHIPAYCVDFMKTVYFSVDSTPEMSVLDAVCATIAIPFLFSSVKLKDGCNYIDGGSAEEIPGASFLGKTAVFALKMGWNRLAEIKDMKSYMLNILYSTMKLRHVYDFPVMDLEIPGDAVFDFSASNENKLKLFLKGYSQKISL